MNDGFPEPLLSVTVPTYKRVDLLERCLNSIVPAQPATAAALELIVSDNSPGSDVEDLVDRFASSWHGPLRYYRNPQGTGAVRNFNYCVERANGQYNLMLHDDDYLLPGGIDAIVRRLRTVDYERDKVVLFGVQDVDLYGNVKDRKQSRVDRYLAGPAALRQLLGDSSFVRVPGLVVESATYRAVGGFRVGAHTTCDFDMAVRLFGQFGVRRVQEVTSAYTIHEGGVTSTVFTPQTIALDLQIFDIARSMRVLSDATIARLQRRWFHQFILAGTWRALRAGDRTAARDRFALLRKDEIRTLGLSPRWLPVRLAFGLLTGAWWRSGRPDGTIGIASAANLPSAESNDDKGGAPTTQEW